MMILITGETGFIGSHLTKALMDHGKSVVTLSRIGDIELLDALEVDMRAWKRIRNGGKIFRICPKVYNYGSKATS